MPFYVSRGKIPHKRHTQFRQPDGSLYREEVFGTKGFAGIESILYHVFPPTSVEAVRWASLTTNRSATPPLSNESAAPSLAKSSATPSLAKSSAAPSLAKGSATASLAEESAPLRHRHFRTSLLKPSDDCDMIAGQVYLLGNEDVRIGVGEASSSMTGFFKNGEEDELFFIHEGNGTLLSPFGKLEFGPGDYLVIPVGTIYQWIVKTPVRFLVIQSPGQVEVPKRYRNEYGQFLEHAPFCERDIRVPEYVEPERQRGSFPIRIKARGGKFTEVVLTHHPFDVVGWDGYVYPYAFNIEDFEPITGRIHQPPPVHQTFMGPNFVVCSFVPRLFDYHPESIPAPNYHSNIDSDEVIYYVRGNFMSRRGISVGSITLHPSGIPHGPHPGTIEASIGKDRTEELAVMLDTFRPLQVLKPALAVEDEEYMFSWRLPDGTDTQ